MDIIGPLSRHKSNTLILYIVMLVLFGLWCAYDGYFNAAFIAKHTEEGRPNHNLLFNRYGAPVMILGAAGLGLWLYRIQSRRIVATDTHLTLSDHRTIPYDSIEQIDKTHFQTKGFFVVTHKTQDGAEHTVRLDDRHYDNLAAVLDRLVEKIS